MTHPRWFRTRRGRALGWRPHRSRGCAGAVAGILVSLALAPGPSFPASSPGSSPGSSPRAASAPLRVEPEARVPNRFLNEISGIVQSRRHPGIYWVHNDSGDQARIFAIREDGSVVVPEVLRDLYSSEPKLNGRKVKGQSPWPGIRIDGATNVDWEDIALCGDTLYIADTGNNGNTRQDLCVYVVLEPDPETDTGALALKRLPVAYPDQRAFPPSDWRFDCEALFVLHGRLHFLTKARGGVAHEIPVGSTTLYRLDTSFTDRPNILTKLETRDDLEGWVTAADVSPDGRTLVVLCHLPVASVWLFPVPEAGGPLLSGRPRRLAFTGARQCEGICFRDDSTLVVANEQRSLFRLKLSGFRP